MNRIDRLFNVLLEFQSHKRLRAQDLANLFGISERTVYRDIAALVEMGVPIITLPGEGYELMEGYFLPPLVFTADEATALSLGVNLLKATGNLRDNALKVVDKISAVLPERTLETVQTQTEMIRFAVPSSQFDLNNRQLWDLQAAITSQRIIRLHYHSLSDDQVTVRDVEPYELVYGWNAWYVEGYCRLRGDIRAFRVDRIDRLQVLNERFEQRSLPPRPVSTSIVVKIRFPNQMLRWVIERQHYAFHELCHESDDTIVMTYHVDSLSEIKAWLLAWGGAAEVLEPLALRQAILDEAKKLVENLT